MGEGEWRHRVSMQEGRRGGAVTPLRTWQYRIRGPKGEWWADVILREGGLFAAVSDWQDGGNGYARHWTHMGTDVRRFFEHMEPDYLNSKVGGPDVIDEEATRAALLRRLAEDDDVNEEDRAAEQERIRDASFESELEWVDFVRESPMEDLWQCLAMKPNPMSWAFCTKVLPLLQEQIRAELAAEATNSSEAPKGSR